MLCQGPCFLGNSPKNEQVLQELNDLKCLKYVDGFVAGEGFIHFLKAHSLIDLHKAAFELWAPRLFRYYKETLQKLREWNPDLEPNFPDPPVFANETKNQGPGTVSYLHRDFFNLSWGWCAITALGRFDPDKGGHLVLWDCNLIIRFPPGSTIFIPSAMVAHMNTPIQKGETRYSIVKYSAAGLFRFVANGCMTDKEWGLTATEEEKKAREEAKKNRWKIGLEMLSTLDEVASRMSKSQ
jgi:hypothetical protein